MTDKHGIPFEEFDVLKVFHFVGARRKKYYMYKIVVLWDGKPYGSHAESNPLTPGYPLWTKERYEDTEIVQSKNWEKLDRPKRRVTAKAKE
jgi:hypothetical protein